MFSDKSVSARNLTMSQFEVFSIPALNSAPIQRRRAQCRVSITESLSFLAWN